MEIWTCQSLKNAPLFDIENKRFNPLSGTALSLWRVNFYIFSNRTASIVDHFDSASISGQKIILSSAQKLKYNNKALKWRKE
jgi:hypothetical protein